MIVFTYQLFQFVSSRHIWVRQFISFIFQPFREVFRLVDTLCLGNLSTTAACILCSLPLYLYRRDTASYNLELSLPVVSDIPFLPLCTVVVIEHSSVQRLLVSVGRHCHCISVLSPFVFEWNCYCASKASKSGGSNGQCCGSLCFALPFP